LSPLVITAHAALPHALAEADVLDLLEELGLDVTLSQQGHLVAFEGSDSGALIAEIDVYELDGGKATQVSWRLHRHPEGESQTDVLVEQVQAFLQASPLWCVDGRRDSAPSPAADQE
jgi:hypothetical protein